ncbi:hypothetical protein HK096_009500 [Nowakowskiella sp. JEL0078]|nr:hypothetical protein HK096_009500 [Nowakowskiella sp. JEL0078]
MFIRGSSSAGAGSGEFHVYRAIRRKEYARVKMLDEKKSEETLQMEFQNKILERQQVADDKTAKKREKRLKRKKASEKKIPLKKNESLITEKEEIILNQL